MQNLAKASKDYLLRSQESTGGFFSEDKIASIRDGSFIAYAMLLQKEFASCEKFLAWVDSIVRSEKGKTDPLRTRSKKPQRGNHGHLPPTIFHSNEEGNLISLPDHQVDGFAAWLWCLAEYMQRTEEDRFVIKYQESIRVAVRFLHALWDHAGIDCWGENPKKIHPSKLACIFGGLERINRFLGEKEVLDLTREIKAFLLSHLTEEGRFPKYLGSGAVDSSLLGLVIPFHVFESDSKPMKKTVHAIDKCLLEEGGVKRYAGERMRPGGICIISTCWYGWYCTVTGKMQTAKRALHSVEKLYDELGYLPEVIPNRTMRQNQASLRNDNVASLWSNAMYLILHSELCARRM